MLSERKPASFWNWGCWVRLERWEERAADMMTEGVGIFLLLTMDYAKGLFILFFLA